MPSGRKTGPVDDTPGPWERWRGSYHGRVIRFIETYCRSPKGTGYGKPMKLATFQKEEIEAMFAADVDAAVESFPRGNGKSTGGAGLATAALFLPHESGAPQVPIIATTVTQAIRSVYGTATWMVGADPELASRATVYSGMGDKRITVPRTGGEMFPTANAEAVIQGLDPSFALADEIGFQPMSAWGGLIQAGGKRSRSLVYGFGTPGVDHDNALWATRQQVISGRDLPRFHYREWSAEPGCALDDREQWRKANPAIGAGFLRESALELDLRLMPAVRFRVFRLGQWVEGVDSWLGDDGDAIWSALTDPWEIPDGSPVWVGVDAAITRDTTAVVHVGLREGVPHAVARFWVPKTDEPTDISAVMAHVRDLADRYKVGAVAFDPRFMDWPAKILHDEGIPMVEISQSAERMTPKIGDLYALIREGGITHDRDPMFHQHIVNAVPRQNERGFTLKKADSRGHIDATIALALAVAEWRGKPKARTLFVG